MAGAPAEAEVPVRLTPPAIWTAETKTIDLPRVPVELLVGSHAHDDAARSLTLAGDAG